MSSSIAYIALLRGINVGGHTVRMEELRLEKVRTYIQSGNVFFHSKAGDAAALTRRIERRLEEALGYEVAVFLRTLPEFEAILAAAPFQALKVGPDMRLCVMFCSEPIRQDLRLPLCGFSRPRGARPTWSGTSATAGRPARRASSTRPSAGEPAPLRRRIP